MTQPARRLQDTGVEIQHHDEVQSFVDGLLDKQPAARPTIETALSRVNALCALCTQSPSDALVIQPARVARTPTTPAPHHTQLSAEVAISQIRALRARIRARRTPGLFVGTIVLGLGGLALSLWPRLTEQVAQYSANHEANEAEPAVPSNNPRAEAEATRSVLKLLPEKKARPEVAPPPEPRDEPETSERTLTERSAATDPDELADARDEQAIPRTPRPEQLNSEPTPDPAHIDMGVGDINYTVPAWRKPLSATDDLPPVHNSPERALRHAFARLIGRIVIQPPSPARREALLRRGILYPHVKAAFSAYDSRAIDRVTFHEAIWLLRERRRQRTQSADDDYARHRTTRAEYTRQYDLISVEFWGE